MSVGFASGTRIRTPRGDVAVDDLRIGDNVVTVSGESRPIMRIEAQTIAQPGREMAPIRVRANAFIDNQPGRDLLLSPGHCIVAKVMDEVFLPVSELVNGATVARETPGEVTYWRVELARHDVILAEGLKVESCLAAAADGGPANATERARPIVVKGPVIDAAQQRLITRAEALGWTRRQDMDLHLLVDGVRCDGDIDGDLARFLFPAAAENVVIASIYAEALKAEGATISEK